jgi:hypothetical protein
MYFYLYDSFVADKKHERLIAAIETRLVDLGISGKVGRMTPFTNARGLIRDEIRCGAKTVVLVGNDDTIAKVLDGFSETNVTLGLLPIGEPNTLAAALGIPTGIEACDVLSRRVIHDIDLGRVNGQLFMTSVVVPKGNHMLEGEGSYRITSNATENEVVIANLGARADGVLANPKDGLLDAQIQPVQEGWLSRFRRLPNTQPSTLRLRRLSIVGSEPVSVIADGARRITSERLLIESVPHSLRVITGKARAFV